MSQPRRDLGPRPDCPHCQMPAPQRTGIHKPSGKHKWHCVGCGRVFVDPVAFRALLMRLQYAHMQGRTAASRAAILGESERKNGEPC